MSGYFEEKQRSQRLLLLLHVHPPHRCSAVVLEFAVHWVCGRCLRRLSGWVAACVVQCFDREGFDVGFDVGLEW